MTRTHRGFHNPTLTFVLATTMATTVATTVATLIAAPSGADAPTPVVCTTPATSSAIPSVPAPTIAQPPAPGEPAPIDVVPPPAPAPTAAPAPAAAELPAATVRGGLDESMVRRIVRAHIDEVRYCYDEGLQRDPDLEGRVHVAFTIGGGDGRVSASEIRESTLGDDEVETCIAAAIERWRFPIPDDHEDVSVTYPFALEPG